MTRAPRPPARRCCNQPGCCKRPLCCNRRTLRAAAGGRAPRRRPPGVCRSAAARDPPGPTQASPCHPRARAPPRAAASSLFQPPLNRLPLLLSGAPSAECCVHGLACPCGPRRLALALPSSLCPCCAAASRPGPAAPLVRRRPDAPACVLCVFRVFAPLVMTPAYSHASPLAPTLMPPPHTVQNMPTRPPCAPARSYFVSAVERTSLPTLPCNKGHVREGEGEGRSAEAAGERRRGALRRRNAQARVEQRSTPAARPLASPFAAPAPTWSPLRPRSPLAFLLSYRSQPSWPRSEPCPVS